jgi:hypothetical protein
MLTYAITPKKSPERSLGSVRGFSTAYSAALARERRIESTPILGVLRAPDRMQALARRQMHRLQNLSL